jgi:hypothetical protein
MNLSETRTRLLRTGIAVAVAAVGMFVVAPASPARAEVIPPSPLVRVQKVVSGPVNTFIGSNVGCPSGTKVVAAGVGNNPGLHPGDAEITALYPSGNNQSVIAFGYIRVSGGSFTIVATCAATSRMSGYIAVEQTYPYAGKVRRQATLRCPAGMYAVGGGGAVFTATGGVSPGAAGMVANTLTSNGTGWIVAISDALPSDSLTIRTWCAPNDGSTIVWTNLPFRPGHLELADVICPTALPYGLTGGVYFAANAAGDPAEGTLNISMQDGDNGWVVGGTSPTPGATIFSLIRCFAT